MKELGIRLITIQFLDSGVLVETLTLEELEPPESAGTRVLTADQANALAVRQQYACSTVEQAKDLVNSMLDDEADDGEAVH